MRIGWVIGVGRHQSLGSFGHTAAVPLAGLQKSKTAWHYHRWRQNTWCLLMLFRRASGFETHSSRFKSLFHHLSSSPPTAMAHYLWCQMTPLMDMQSTSTSIIISFAHTLRMATLILFTLWELSTQPISSLNRLVVSSFKSTLHDLVWVLTEGVCWELLCDFIKCPCGCSSLLLLQHIFMTLFLTSLIHEWTSWGQAPITFPLI